MIENKFVIIIPVYNAINFIEKCIDSIMSQSYQNFTLITVDDGSTDGTTDIIYDLWKNEWNKSRFLFHRNGIRYGSPLRSFVTGVSLYDGDKQDIIITVDGDDWLYGDNVLDYMNDIYQDPDVWLTYGQFKSVSGNLDGYCTEVTDTRTYRRHQEWTTGHLRTLRKGLFDKINPKDFLQKDGSFYNKYNDTAYMFPAIEMAGVKHIKFIDKILYVYNDKNPLCSIYDFDNAHLQADWDMGEEIRNKKPYDEIPEL